MNFLGKLFSPLTYSSLAVKGVEQQKAVVPKKFNNPFLNSDKSDTYGKNNPIQGGLFAGYINDKPNYVGRNLFISV